jgi:hypothetical protein
MSVKTPDALFRLSDFAEHKDPSGEAWIAFQVVDAHITALHAEVERLTRERDEARRVLRFLLGDALDDPSVNHVEIQVDATDLVEARAALEADRAE